MSPATLLGSLSNSGSIQEDQGLSLHYGHAGVSRATRSQRLGILTVANNQGCRLPQQTRSQQLSSWTYHSMLQMRVGSVTLVSDIAEARLLREGALRRTKTEPESLEGPLPLPPVLLIFNCFRANPDP